MQVRTDNDFDNFSAAHRDDWKRIAEASPRATVFQTAEWGSAWWRHFGGRGRRFLGLIFLEDGVIVGLAPLWRDPLTSEARGFGDGESDYLDLLALPDCEVSVIRALLSWLAGDGRRLLLDIRQARPDGVLASRIAEASSGVADARTSVVTGEACPFTVLPATWNEYRATLGKKRRSNIGYYGRQLEKHFADVTFRLADADTLANDMESFFELHQRRWNSRWLPGAFVSASTRRFHYDAAQSLLASGNLRLHLLSLNGRVEAALYCFHKDRTTYYYLGGFEPELARFSIGTVLTAHAIRHAIEGDGATGFDFLRGNEAYKYQWAAADRHNLRIMAARRGIGLPIAALSARATLAAELGLKHWMHARFGGAGSSAGEKHG